MQTFKKVFISCLSVVCIFTLVSVIIIEPMIQTEANYYCDASFRKETAGKYDTLFIGDSDGMASFIPSKFDEKSNRKSINLSSSMLTLQSMSFLLEKEMKRNDIKTVFLQVSFQTFSRNNVEEYGDGEYVMLRRVDSFGERIKYINQCVRFNDLLNIYSRLMTDGIIYWKNTLTHSPIEKYNSDNLGWHSKEANNIYLEKEQAINLYTDKKVMSLNCDEYKNELSEIVDICKDNNVDLYFIFVPVADSTIWKYEDWDKLNKSVSDFCQKQDVGFIDFNLIKMRYLYFNDEESFADSVHMSKSGAESFTDMLCDVYNDILNGKEITDQFYDSYCSMKQDSPYMEYIK